MRFSVSGPARTQKVTATVGPTKYTPGHSSNHAKRSEMMDLILYISSIKQPIIITSSYFIQSELIDYTGKDRADDEGDMQSHKRKPLKSAIEKERGIRLLLAHVI